MRTRLKILWMFIKTIPYARELEVEWQAHQQLMNDYEFAGPYSREKFLEQKGFVDGVKWCINRFS
jgi:hypothetical protein